MGFVFGIFLGAMGDMQPLQMVNGREVPQAPLREQVTTCDPRLFIMMAAHVLVALLSTPLLIDFSPVGIHSCSCFRVCLQLFTPGTRGVQADSGAISQLREKFRNVFRCGAHPFLLRYIREV